MPSQNDKVSVYEQIYGLSKENHSPIFPPHCTLYGPVFNLDTAKGIIDKIEMNPFLATSFGLNQSDNIWKTVFIELEMNDRLNKLNQIFQNAFSSNYDFKPHISLIYKTMTKDQRLAIITEIEIQKSYDFSGIAVVDTSGPVDEWESVYQSVWNK